MEGSLSSEPLVHFGYVTAAHGVRAGGPQKGQPSPSPRTGSNRRPQRFCDLLHPRPRGRTLGPSLVPVPSRCSARVAGFESLKRPSRQRHPRTRPPWTGSWPPRCESTCKAVPEACPHVTASRWGAAAGSGAFLRSVYVATAPARQLISSVSLQGHREQRPRKPSVCSDHLQDRGARGRGVTGERRASL